MDLYYLPLSAPCRSVQMAAKAVGVDLNLKQLDLFAGEHLKPEFVKINPQHTIPTLVDDGFALWESRAILIYLVEKYAKTDSLYPKCPKKRAVVNQRLFFDLGTLYQKYSEYYYPQVFFGKPADPEKYKQMETALDFFETFLDGQTYAAGDSLTIADLALLATISSFDAAGYDLSKYQNISKWYKHVESVTPGADINREGTEVFREMFNKIK